MRKTIPFLFPFFLFLVVSFSLSILPANIADSDGFYHLKHAYIYRINGLFDSSFPWAQFSVIKNEASDIWYGFHILLIPFSYFKDLTLGLEIGTRVITAIGLLLFYLALRGLKIKWPLFWTLVFLFGLHRILARFTLLRPQVLSLGLVALIFSLFLEKKKSLAIFLTSLAISFIHINVSWAPLIILGILSFYRFIIQGQINRGKIGLVLSGLIAGILIRPNPLGAIRLTLINLSTIKLYQSGQIPLNLGMELLPLDKDRFFATSTPFLMLLGIFFLVFLFLVKKGLLRRIPNQRRIVIFSCLTLILGFGYMSFFQAARAIDFLAGFVIIFMGIVWEELLSKLKKYKGYLKIAAIPVLFGIISCSSYGYVKAMDVNRALVVDPFLFKGAADWLEANSQEGEIVFHPEWDNFGGLFFFNDKNYYINGMDPVFEYAYSPKLAWQHYYLYTDKFPLVTCSKGRDCQKEDLIDTYTSLKDNFQADYVFVTRTHKRLYSYLNQEPGFHKVYEDENQAVFEIEERGR